MNAIDLTPGSGREIEEWQPVMRRVDEDQMLLDEGQALVDRREDAVSRFEQGQRPALRHDRFGDEQRLVGVCRIPRRRPLQMYDEPTRIRTPGATRQ